MTSWLRAAIFASVFVSYCSGAISADSEPPTFKPLAPAATKLKQLPSPGEYVAFSLKVAEARVEAAKGDYRDSFPEVFYLAGINRIHGLVHDRQGQDVILVGGYDPQRAPLTLDDLAVALRSRFVHGKWPVVSIDPAADTEKTQMQRVRFEGGIENTQFGQDLLEADYRLKQIGMGLLPAGVQGLRSYWDLFAATRGDQQISSRFWFYPVLPSVPVRDDVVAVRGLKVGVFTEVMGAKIDGKQVQNLATFNDAAGDEFASTVSARFVDLARAHASFSRVQGLDELVAIAKAVEEMEPKPSLDYWLQGYRVRKVATPPTIKVLVRDDREVTTMDGGKVRLHLSGGAQLMAMALRLKAGDVTSLKEAVLTARPKPASLSWTFIVGDWIIPTSMGMVGAEQVAALLAHAAFLLQKGRYSDAIAIYDKVIELTQ